MRLFLKLIYIYCTFFIFWEDEICATMKRVCMQGGLHACVKLAGGFPVCLWGVHVPQVLLPLLQWWTPCSLGDSPPLQSAEAQPGECSKKEN